VLTTINSGIFGYVNYLVEKDRKTILDTLVNGTSHATPDFGQESQQAHSADA